METGLVDGVVGLDGVIVIVASRSEKGASVYPRIGDGVIEDLENRVGFIGTSHIQIPR